MNQANQDKSNDIILKILRQGDLIRIVHKTTNDDKIVIVKNTISKKFNIIGVYSEYSNSLLLSLNFKQKSGIYDTSFDINFSNYNINFVSFKEFNFIKTTVEEQCSKEVNFLWNSCNSRNRSMFKEFSILYFKEYPKDTENRMAILKNIMINNRFPKDLIIPTDTWKMKKFRTKHVINCEKEIAVDKKYKDLDNNRKLEKDNYRKKIDEIKKNMIIDRLGRAII